MLRIHEYLARCALWFGHYSDAQKSADHAMNFSQKNRDESGMILAACLQGMAALGSGDLSLAEERLHHVVTRAREVNAVIDELQALIGLAEVRRQQRNLTAARELLEEVWEPAKRGPFPILHADTYNVLAQIERDAGNHSAAVEAAIAAYRLAWCDGPPFAYHWGLQTARAHLSVLGAREPESPPFNASKYEPMPQVEIEPPASSAEQNPDDLY
jgi:tetratricopeptide (TPR) repeat protein